MHVLLRATGGQGKGDAEDGQEGGDEASEVSEKMS